MSEMTWPEAIQAVLADAGEALHYSEITERILVQGLKTTMGATPADTVAARMAHSIKHEGSASPYVRVAPGMYTLSEKAVTRSNKASAVELSSEDMEDEDLKGTGLINAFGMFWDRSAIRWGSNSRLLGRQGAEATVVDFWNQRGIYLLYDRREVVYVGRSTDRPLGLRLFEHTKDRMASRWDRFSWFGLLGVTDDGSLHEPPEGIPYAVAIPDLEAIFIEALEPRLNRRRGDDLAAREFWQVEDPELQKQREDQILQQLLRRTGRS